MDLICTSMSTVNLPYVLYFFCFGAGGLMTFFVIDKLGRLKSHRIFSTLHYVAQTIIIFIPNMLARTIGFCLLGSMMAKNSLTTTWSFEFVLKDHKSSVISCINMCEFSVCVIGGLYFLFINTDWRPLVLGMYSFNVFGYLLITFLCPESPKWLLL